MLALEIYGVQPDAHYGSAALAAVAGFWLVAEAQGIYGSWRTASLRDEFGQVVLNWLIFVIAFVLCAFLLKISATYSRLVIVAWFALVPVGLMAFRAALRTALHQARRMGFNARTVAIVGTGRQAKEFIKALDGAQWMGLRLVGVYDDSQSPQHQEEESLDSTGSPLVLARYPVRGSIGDLITLARKGGVDFVYIALPMRQERKILELVNALADTTASVYYLPDLFLSDLLHSKLVSVAGLPMVSVYESPFFGSSGWIKRFEDLVLGSMILLLIAVPMLAIAVGVKLSSPGSVLFRQRRYGLNGEVVEVWKFRSMTVVEDGDHVPQAKMHDPRVTPFGAFLRRTSLDELPQFINVLQGHMSIVGPRPHAVAHSEQYRRLVHGYMLRHKVKPGITGWAQVNGWRGETDTVEKMRKRVEYDLEYVRNWSLWLDLKIVGLTIVRGFRGPNAY